MTNSTVAGIAKLDWKYLLTSFEGRITPRSYWMGVLALLAVNVIIGVVVGIVAAIVPPLAYAGMVLGLATLYPAAALSAKRWHDIGKSGWWSLVVAVPLFGAIYAVYQLGFVASSDESNQFGNRPLVLAST